MDAGLSLLADPMSILAIIIGVAIGIVFGSIPGFSATMTIILLTPVTVPFASAPALIPPLSIRGSGIRWLNTVYTD